MILLNLQGIVLVYHFGFLMADQRICRKENEKNDQITNFTNLSLRDQLSCKKRHPSTLFIPPVYNRDIGPWEYRNSTNMQLPWIFTMEFHIYDIHEIDDEKLTITFDVQFKVKWMEPRLEINVSLDTWKNGAIQIDGEDHYLIPLENMEDLWIPSFEMHHLELYQPQKILKETANLRINGTKFIRYIVKVKIVLRCQMTFDNYPFDSHTCLHKIGSYHYPKKIWDCTSIAHFYDSQKRNLQYSINIIELPPFEGTFDEALSKQKWATCGFQIELMRKKTQIFVQVYLTSGLLVILAWVSFIIPPDLLPGRMGLLVTVFLMLLTLFISVKRDAPPSNGFLNAVDIFLVSCICHVFFGFIEYAVVLFLSKNTKMVLTLEQTESINEHGRHSNQIEDMTKIAWPDSYSKSDCPDQNQSNGKWNKLDLTLFFAYPVSFALFCTIYFSKYLEN